MKKKFNRYVCLLCTVCLWLFALPACKKANTELPGDTAATALNFYAPSDVMKTAYSSAVTSVQVDTFYKHPFPFPFVQGSTKFPTWGFGSFEGAEFPTIDNGFMNFAHYNYKDGGHRLFFTDTANVVILDTIIHPAPKSYSCIYLADAPVTTQNKPALYRMLEVTENRADNPADKTGIRFVHLSPDAGSLDCKLLKADNSMVPLLPEKLSYGQASAYQYVNSTEASDGLVKLILNNATNGATITTGIPILAGHGYIVVITGFFNDQQRQVRSGTNPDGSAKYTSININKNLRAIVRKSY